MGHPMRTQESNPRSLTMRPSVAWGTPCLVRGVLDVSGVLAGGDGLGFGVGEVGDFAFFEEGAVAGGGVEVEAGLVEAVPGGEGGGVGGGFGPGEDGAAVAGADEGVGDALGFDTAGGGG